MDRAEQAAAGQAARWRMLVEQLGESDRVAIVVYAGASGLRAAADRRHERSRRSARRSTSLEAGGSTNGGERHPARLRASPREHFIAGGVNRVILCTDGDFNVGVTSHERPGRADRGEGARAASSSPCSASAWATSRTRRWSSSPTRATATTPTSTRSREARKVLVEQIERHARDDRQGREDPGRVQPGAGRRLPPDRLREPRAARPRTSTTTRRTPARSAPATR